MILGKKKTYFPTFRVVSDSQECVTVAWCYKVPESNMIVVLRGNNIDKI